MMRKRGARSATAAATHHDAVPHGQERSQALADDMIDLGDWRSDDGGSFSDIDSDEEKKRLKHRRRRLRAKQEKAALAH